MKKLALFLLALAIIACSSNATGTVKDTHPASATDTPPTKVDDDYVPQRSDYSFRTEVRTITEDNEVRWDTIIVYLTDAKGNTQKLYTQALPLDTVNWQMGSIGEIEEDDWNFDGISDLQVCTGPMNGYGNYTYDVWLWNDKTHQFEYLEVDDAIFSPRTDPENKCIISVWRLDDKVEIVRYKWKDGRLVETEREQMTYGELVGE